VDEGTGIGADAAPVVLPDRDGPPPRATPARPHGGSVPSWLARSGRSAWAVVGVVLACVAVVVALTVLLPLLAPLIVAGVLAAVLLPAVGWLSRRRVPRTLASALGALLVPALVTALVVITVRALRGQRGQWDQTARTAGERLRSELGFDPLSALLDALDRREVLLGLASVLAEGAAATVALGLGALLAVYILLFLLKDAPRFTDALAARLPLPPATTRELVGTARLGLSRYAVGTTVVAAMDAAVITVGAILLDLPLVLVIALVTFAAAYVPYLGAWLSGAFAVVVALGSAGADAALWMLAIVLVTQTLLEGVLRPFAFGVALNLHPLTVLAVTLLGGALGGVIGVFIAPPATAIALSWLRTIRASRPAPPEPPTDPGRGPIRLDGLW
jgi:predicted PurR-regulated permease PerM